MRRQEIAAYYLLAFSAAGLLAGCNKTPQDAEHIIQGTTYDGQQLYDKAIAEFDAAIALKPDQARPYYMRGMVYVHQGKPDQALLDFDKACGMSDRDACTMSAHLKNGR
jgi:tetratricopeptide (TPR) repeat protein